MSDKIKLTPDQLTEYLHERAIFGEENVKWWEEMLAQYPQWEKFLSEGLEHAQSYLDGVHRELYDLLGI